MLHLRGRFSREFINVPVYLPFSVFHVFYSRTLLSILALDLLILSLSYLLSRTYTHTHTQMYMYGGVYIYKETTTASFSFLLPSIFKIIPFHVFVLPFVSFQILTRQNHTVEGISDSRSNPYSLHLFLVDFGAFLPRVCARVAPRFREGAARSTGVVRQSNSSLPRGRCARSRVTNQRSFLRDPLKSPGEPPTRRVGVVHPVFFSNKLSVLIRGA